MALFMIVAFLNPELRRIASDKKHCEATYGLAASDDIITSIAELEAAESMEALITAMLCEVIDKERGEAIMRGQSDVEIQIVENHARPSDVRYEGFVDWSFVRRVMVASFRVNK